MRDKARDKNALEALVGGWKEGRGKRVERRVTEGLISLLRGRQGMQPVT